VAGTEPPGAPLTGLRSIPLWMWMGALLLAALAVAYWRDASAKRRAPAADDDAGDAPEGPGPSPGQVAGGLFADNGAGSNTGSSTPPTLTAPSWPSARRGQDENDSQESDDDS
jgi:hypothetical protein